MIDFQIDSCGQGSSDSWWKTGDGFFISINSLWAVAPATPPALGLRGLFLPILEEHCHPAMAMA